MKVAILGTRGIPASYSGFETAAEQLASRLIDDPDRVEAYRARARKRATRYSWEAVTDSYEKLLRDVLDARRPGRLPPELIDADVVAA